MRSLSRSTACLCPLFLALALALSLDLAVPAMSATLETPASPESAAGPHWTPTGDFTTSPVTSLIVTPSEPSFVIAYTGNGIFRSADQGATWAPVFSSQDGPFFAEALDPRFPRTVYSFGNDGQADDLFVSNLAGRAQRLLPFPFSCGGEDSICDVELSAFALDPRHPDTLYVAGTSFFHFAGGAIYLLRSSNAFASWQALPVPARLDALAVAPDKPGVLYALTCAGFLRSQDSAASWQAQGYGLPTGLCFDLPGCSGCGRPRLTIDPQHPSTLYVAAGAHGIFQSVTSGRTFHPMSAGLPPSATVTSLLIDPSNRGKLYAGVPQIGVFAWNGAQQAWLPLDAGLPVAEFDGVLALDPLNPAVLYAGTSAAGVFRLDPP